MLDTDIAQLMSVLPSFDEELCVRGGVFRDTQDDSTPFGYQRCEGIHLFICFLMYQNMKTECFITFLSKVRV